ncbi:MAG TPA: GNAT family N-acetyltransferase [Candidatus Latescibacteria bacterium]|nr:GNAT family N-acetyltransferase [Candidatus Latescibacterota bacterium]
MVDGPRAVKPEEFWSLVQMVNKVFRAKGGDMQAEFPHVFNAGNLSNLRVIVEDGQVVSHVGIVLRDVTIYGCRLTVGCIGVVATAEEYRGRGLASKLLIDAFARIEEAGGSLILISGGRGLYRRNGCVPVSRATHFEIPRSFATKKADPKLVLKAFKPDEIPTVSALYRREPVRFLRPVEDYRYFLDSGMAMDRPSGLWLIKRGSRAVAYAVVQRATTSAAPHIVEYAGDRRAIVESLAMIISYNGDTDTLNLSVPVADEPFRWQLKELGLTPVGQEMDACGCTVRIQKFPLFLQCIRPYLTEILDSEVVRSLRVEDSGPDVTFYLEKQRFTLLRDDATALVFGTPEGIEHRILEGDGGAVAEVLGKLFPLPAPWYGLNFV